MMRIGLQFDTRSVPDALTLFAMAGGRTRRIELGTSVIPLPTRHVVTLAQQALTTQLARSGWLCLRGGAGYARSVS